MQKQIIYKHEKQTIFDFLLQYSGAISSVFEFLNDNSLTDLNISEGEYIAPIVYNQNIVDYFNPKQVVNIDGYKPEISTNSVNNPITVTINGGFYKIINSSVINIPLKNSNGNTLDYTVNVDDVVVDDIQISFYANGIFQKTILVPVGANETININ